MRTAAGPPAPTAPHGIFGRAIADRGFRRERALLIGCLLLAAAASWGWLLNGAGTLEEMGGMLMPMSSGPWTASHAGVMFAMWAAMMAAMMLPSAVPRVLFYALLARRQREGTRAGGPAALFVAGYVAVWLAFSASATGLQFVLERLSLLSPMMQATSVALASGVLIAAGIYQWMPLKQSCLRRCRSPLEFVLTYWRPGASGALKMGLRHGADCLGCCWALMALLFFGGVMNLYWIAGLALFVLVEKIAPAGHWIGRAGGVLLVAWGVAAWFASFPSL
jgi:predicted metal-binding membrane protein